MAKFCGVIGFAKEPTESSPGVWTESIVERTYYGDVDRNIRRLQSIDKINDDIVISVELSIVADPYANENFHAIRYAKFMGTKWKVNVAEPKYPRIVLTLGGVYNG